MRFTSTIASIASLLAAVQAENINCNNENGVATCLGHICTGAIYIGCDYAVSNAFCCVGAPAEQNICNNPQPTTCPQGSYLALSAAPTADATATSNSASFTPSAQASSVPAGGSSPARTSAPTAFSTSSSSGNAAATAGVLPAQIGAGALAVVVKVLFL